MTALLLATLLAAASPEEEAVAGLVARRFEAAGRRTPATDPMLSRAARAIAQRALEEGVVDASGLLRVTAAISRAGGWDPSPGVVAVRAAPEALLSLLERRVSTDEPVTHVGVASLSETPTRAAAVVLLARRRIELAPFERAHRAPTRAPQRLCGRLAPPLSSAEVFVTRPSGVVDSLPMRRDARGLCASISFAAAGRHAVEVLARGPRGPEVVALFFVDVGPVPESDDEWQDEPATDAEARAVLLQRINALRERQGAGAVIPDEILERVAQRWAERLAAENFFAHVGPDGSDLKARLAEGGYPYAAAGENLGAARGPLAAHFGIEHSPGHRRNLLEPDHQHLGIGIARRDDRDDQTVVIVELLARPIGVADRDANGLEAAYAALAAERARRGLPALTLSPELEALAQAHARAALAAQLPKAELPGQPSPHQRAFELLESARSVAVDVYVSDTPRPAPAPDAKNLGSARNTHVGVGLVRGNSPQFGDGRYWIVVMYAANE
jgi:uncharacterized protein YkwD